jgi:flavorubredoxin
LKIADSLRSSLSKIALLTLNDMFVYLKRCIEPDLDNIIKQLLKKATDTNIFISEEAEKALVSMCNNCNESKVLQILLI